jgi:hypothetical protein
MTNGEDTPTPFEVVPAQLAAHHEGVLGPRMSYTNDRRPDVALQILRQSSELDEVMTPWRVESHCVDDSRFQTKQEY